MALSADHNASATAPEAATDTLVADDIELVVSDAGADLNGAAPAGVVVAAAGDNLKADLTLLGLEDLLALKLDEDGASGHQGAQPEADGDGAGRQNGRPEGSVPLILNDDLPADLTALGLDQLLGLDLSGVTLPTLGEVAAVAFAAGFSDDARPDNGADSDDASSDNGADNDGDNATADSDVQLSTTHFSDAGDLSVIEDVPLTVQALSNSAEVAKAASQGHANGKLFVLDDELPGLRIGQKDTSDTEGYDDGDSFGGPEGEQGGGSGGGGTNVINGTAGDDVLNGTAGTDLINGMNGNDFLDGGAGADKLHGGQGDDIMIWDSIDTQIMGSNGTDTVRVTGSDADFTMFGGVINNIEIVDLEADAGANALTVTYADVLAMTDNGDTLIIDGDGLDSVDAGAGWTDGGVAGGYHTYTQGVGPNTATLLIDTDITNVLV